ncbi:hypothetical protein EGW08_011707 [Elysia chlorotica]|uniref:Uncharacterized protein n=1 Tax=Elysia chlorotica TaxID=188477 RepID=A0A433TG25_ELYCH|nr:hypothetical protein EGW08_011707 [Elysia chlorotica]
MGDQPRQQKAYRNGNFHPNRRWRSQQPWNSYRRGARYYQGHAAAADDETSPPQRNADVDSGDVQGDVGRNNNNVVGESSGLSEATGGNNQTAQSDGEAPQSTDGQLLLSLTMEGNFLALNAMLGHREKFGATPILQRDLNLCLLGACRSGRKFFVQKLVRSGAEVGLKGYRGTATPLHIAAQQGYTDIADFLLSKGAEVNALDPNANTALILSVNPAGSCDMLNLLVAHKAQVNHQNLEGVTALMKAVEVMDIDAVRILLFAGSDQRLRCRLQRTARDIALKLDLAEVYDALVYELEKRTKHSYPVSLSALTKAMMENQKEAVEILLDSRIMRIKDKPQPPYRQQNESVRNAALKKLIEIMCSTSEAKKKVGAKLEIAKILLASGAQPEKGSRSGFPSALIEATKSGIYELVQVISSYADNRPNFLCDDHSALMVAVEKGRTDILQLLLSIGADPKVVNKKGETALYCALSNGQIECAKILIEAYKPSVGNLHKIVRKAVIGSQLKSLEFLASHCDMTAISQSMMKDAVLTGDLKVVQFLVDHGADINGTSDDPSPALTLALSCGKENMLDIVKFLVEHGASVNRTGTEVSPLVTAVCNNCSLDVLRYLLEKGAEVNQVGNDDGSTPLTAAFNFFNYVGSKQHPDRIELLLESGADPNQAKSNGDTALHLAVSEGNIGIVKQIIDAGAELEVKNCSGLTPLLLASSSNDPELIALLKRCGANLKAVDNTGKTGLIRLLETRRNPDVEALKLLAYDGSQLNLQTQDGATPLMIAASVADFKAIQVLLELGADPNVEDTTKSSPRTALSILLNTLLFKQHAMPCVTELIQHGALRSLPKHCFLPLYHMFMSDNREAVQLLVTKGMPPLCIDFVAMGGSMFSAFMMGISNTLAGKFSPLASALVRNRITVARYIVGNWFFTHVDVVGREELSHLRTALKNTNKAQSLSFLEEFMSQPMSLVQLSFVAVSAQLGDIAGREERVRKLPLPTMLQDKLLYKKEIYPMDFAAVDENAGDNVSSADEVDENDSLTSDYSDYYYGSDVDLEHELYDYEDGYLF